LGEILAYTRRSTPTQLEIGNATQLNSFNITNVVADHGVNSIEIPTSCYNRIEAAYLDIYLPYVRNYNAGANSLDDASGNGSIQVKALVGGTWIDAIYMIDQSMYTPASTTVTRGRVAGNLDVKAQVNIAANPDNASHLLSVQWKNAKAHLDGFTIAQLQVILRIWLR
jgi:hypothetical protein